MTQGDTHFKSTEVLSRQLRREHVRCPNFRVQGPRVCAASPGKQLNAFSSGGFPPTLGGQRTHLMVRLGFFTRVCVSTTKK